MKRKTIALMTAFTLVMSLSACGGKTATTGNNSDAERIAELEQELEELKAEQIQDDNETVNEAESLLKTTMESPEASGVSGANSMWYYKEGVLVITGTGEMTDFGWNVRTLNDPIIPNSPWYELEDKIGWVIIDKGVTRIGEAAFAECYMISKIIIPDTVTSIGEHAFSGLGKNLETVIYGEQSYTFEEFEDMIEESGMED